MESHDAMGVHPRHASHHPPERRHAIGPVDRDYRVVVRTVLWVIAGLVFLGFGIWWVLTLEGGRGGARRPSRGGHYPEGCHPPFRLVRRMTVSIFNRILFAGDLSERS